MKKALFRKETLERKLRALLKKEVWRKKCLEKKDEEKCF